MPNPDKPDIRQVIERIRELQRMSQLEPKDFALPGAMAEEVALATIDADLNSTQLYKIFHELKQLEIRVRHKAGDPFDSNQVAKIMPLLIYAAGRKVIPKSFFDLLKEVFGPQRLQTNADFLRAFEFVEAILAYHKYHSERKKGGGGQ